MPQQPFGKIIPAAWTRQGPSGGQPEGNCREHIEWKRRDVALAPRASKKHQSSRILALLDAAMLKRCCLIDAQCLMLPIVPTRVLASEARQVHPDNTKGSDSRHMDSILRARCDHWITETLIGFNVGPSVTRFFELSAQALSDMHSINTGWSIDDISTLFVTQEDYRQHSVFNYRL